MRFRFALRVLSLAFSLTTSISAGTQSVPTTNIAHYQEQVRRCEETIDTWQRDARIQIALTAAVIVFGALITVLQAFKHGWCKTATGILGATTTIFTGINAKVVTADYRLLQQVTIDGQEMTEKLKFLADRLGSALPDVQRTELEGEWVKALGEFHSLQKQVLAGVRDASRASLLPIVHAQTSRSLPTWARTPISSDEYDYYFVGHGDDKSLQTAQKKSFDDAVEKATSQLGGGARTDPTALRKFIATFATVESTWLDFDKATNVYNYYTRLRLGKEIEKISPPSPAPIVYVVKPFLVEVGEAHVAYDEFAAFRLAERISEKLGSQRRVVFSDRKHDAQGCDKNFANCIVINIDMQSEGTRIRYRLEIQPPTRGGIRIAAVSHEYVCVVQERPKSECTFMVIERFANFIAAFDKAQSEQR